MWATLVLVNRLAASEAGSATPIPKRKRNADRDVAGLGLLARRRAACYNRPVRRGGHLRVCQRDGGVT